MALWAKALPDLVGAGDVSDQGCHLSSLVASSRSPDTLPSLVA
jgi:hypothetical protein